jgi:hypothetical protein
MKRERAALCLGIYHQFVNKNGDHGHRKCPHYKDVKFGSKTWPPVARTYDWVSLTTDTTPLGLDTLFYGILSRIEPSGQKWPFVTSNGLRDGAKGSRFV